MTDGGESFSPDFSADEWAAKAKGFGRSCVAIGADEKIEVVSGFGRSATVPPELRQALAVLVLRDQDFWISELEFATLTKAALMGASGESERVAARAALAKLAKLMNPVSAEKT